MKEQRNYYNPDKDINLYSTRELEVMKDRLNNGQSSVFSLSELQKEIDRRNV